MQMEKRYNLGGCEAIVRFKPKLIQLEGSPQLLAYLATNLNTNTLNLVKLIKADYFNLFGKRLRITHASLMIEIWGHLYASKLAIALNELMKLNFIQNISTAITKRSDTIDCGEADIDSNRKFWDLLSKFNKTIVKFL